MTSISKKLRSHWKVMERTAGFSEWYSVCDVTLEGLSDCLTWWIEAYNVMKKRGSSMDAGHLLHTYLSNNPSFENVGYQSVHCPVGPWKRGRTPEEDYNFRMMG